MKSPSALLLAVMFIAGGSFAQTIFQSAKPAARLEAKYSVSGTVINSATGEPISRALVQILSGSQLTAFTDTAGHFEFAGLLPGMIGVTARRPGFLPQEDLDPAFARPVAIVGPDSVPVLLKLVPLGVIFGRALKPEGDPIRNLPVQLLYFQITDGRKRWDLMNSTTTNDDGEFRIANLKPGRYTLAAGPTSRSGWMGAPGSRAHEGGYPPLFYPGVSDWTSSTPLDVSPGQQVEALFSMAPEPLFRVSGSITGMGAEPAWAQIQISPRAIDTQNIQVDQQPDGSFETKVPAGSYTIRASGNAPTPFQGELPVTVRSDITGLNLIVAPAPNLPVEIVIQRTAVSVSSHSVPRMLLTRVNVRLHGQVSKLPTPDYAFSLGTDKNSEHNIHDVAPGIYSVEFNPATPDLYVESAQCGGTDLLRENLTLTPGATTPVRLVLRDDGGTIMGNVVYGGHGSPATVLIIPDRASSRVFPLPVEPDGRFQSPKLAPGDYTVLAFDRISGLEYTNPEVLESYLSYATHASVAANGETGVTVNLVRSGK